MGKKKSKAGTRQAALRSPGDSEEKSDQIRGPCPRDAFRGIRSLLEKNNKAARASSAPPPVKTELYGEIFSVAPMMNAAECAACVDAAESVGFGTASQKASKTYAHRDNDRLCVLDPEFAEALWQRTWQHVPLEIEGRAAVGLSERIRVYKYAVGQSFGQHVDESVEEAGGWSEHTMLVYLNGEEGGGGELRGGETVFYRGSGKKQKPVVTFAPLRGAALLHGHGLRCLLHEAKEVIRGVKYLLRTDVVYR